jgi:hypothetical protein
VYELVKKEADDGKRVAPLEEDDDDAPEPAIKKAKSDLVVATECAPAPATKKAKSDLVWRLSDSIASARSVMGLRTACERPMRV